MLEKKVCCSRGKLLGRERISCMPRKCTLLKDWSQATPAQSQPILSSTGHICVGQECRHSLWRHCPSGLRGALFLQEQQVVLLARTRVFFGGACFLFQLGQVKALSSAHWRVASVQQTAIMFEILPRFFVLKMFLFWGSLCRHPVSSTSARTSIEKDMYGPSLGPVPGLGPRPRSTFACQY